MTDDNVNNSCEPEDAEVYNDHSVDNSVHHSVNLWPIPTTILLIGLFKTAGILGPDYMKAASKRVPWGKSYTAVGQIINCVPFQFYPSMTSEEVMNVPYRGLIRTTDDNIFEVAFRNSNIPPQFGFAVGVIKYHECGVQGGKVVHCIDLFKYTHEAVKPLDNNGQPVK